jgi:predicted metalloprotease with PDZ domain
MLHTAAMKLLSALIAAALIAASLAGRMAVAQPAATAKPACVEYVVHLDRPQTQTVDIEATFPGVTTPTLDVMLPVWRPGRYVVLDPAGMIRTFAASLADGAPLPAEKIDKSTWRITLPRGRTGPRDVTVRYTVYANSLKDRTRHVDDSHAFLSPSTAFVYTAEHRSHPLRVTVRAPEGWRTATGLAPDPTAPGSLLAPDYDVLVDSPLEIGLHDLIRFDVDGIPHEIVAWPPGAMARDHDTIAAEFAAIVRTQRAMFGNLPYDRYVFILHITPDGSGGTEHLNSFVAQTSRAAFEDRGGARYRRFLGLISHEMFHTWNVKQLRPADLRPYDYQRENYTTLLWLVEGTTSYYDDLCLVRATGPNGKPLMTPDDYLELLGDTITTERARPGLHVQSLAHASFDAWIKYNRQTPDSVNSTVSFYTKGALVSLLLDMEVRARSAGRVSLDDVLRTLYERFPLSGGGYRVEDVVGVLEELTGSDFTAFFDQHINRPGDLPLESALRTVGIDLLFEPAEKNDDGTPAQKPYAGLKLGGSRVSAVYADGPAALAGVLVGDEIIAINGRRFESGLDTHLARHKPGDRVEFTLFRRDELRTVVLTLAGKPDGSWVLKRTPEPTPEQRAAYEDWLRRPWPAEEGAD